MSVFDFLRSLVARVSPMSRFGVARAYAREGRYDKAEHYFELFLDIEAMEADVSPGTLAQMLEEVGDCAAALGKRDKAVGVWHKALSLARLTPSTGSTLFKIARAHLADGRIPDALDTFDRAFDAERGVHPDDPIRAARLMIDAANDLRAAGARAHARELLRRAAAAALAADPSGDPTARWHAYAALGPAAHRCDLFALACESYDRVLADPCVNQKPFTPAVASLLLNRASAEYSDGRYADAARTLDQFDARPPPADDENGIDLRLCADAWRVGVLSFSGDHVAAETCARRACARMQSAAGAIPTPHRRATVFATLAWALLRRHDQLDEVGRLLEQARTLAAGSSLEPFVIGNLGCLQYLRGQFEPAEQSLLRSIQLHEERRDGVALAEDAMTLARCYLDTARHADARKTLEAARDAVADLWRDDHPRRLELDQLAARAQPS
jgi:tetratricopeptide (TPR) repeat protein